MRLIGIVPTESDARRFCDYLLTQKIDAHAEEQASDGAWQIWIEHDDHLDAGKAELERFRTSPTDPRYGSAATTAKKLREQQEKEAMRRRANYRDVRTSWASTAMGKYGSPVALALIFISIVVGGLTSFGENEASPLYHALLYDYNPALFDESVSITKAPSMFDSVRRGEVWRVVTPMFIHYGVFHLVFNMMWMWQLGRLIESRKGSVLFLVMTLVIAALSCTAQALWDYSIFGGMSGVVAGLFGYAWMKSRLQPYEGIHVTEREVGYMLVWLVVCSLGFIGSIANAAHWGGLAVGMVFGVMPYVSQRWLRRS